MMSTILILFCFCGVVYGFYGYGYDDGVKQGIETGVKTIVDMLDLTEEEIAGFIKRKEDKDNK